MNEHSIRLINQIYIAIEEYLTGKIEQIQMFNLVEGSINAIDESSVKKRLEKFLIVINDSIYLFNENDGKAYLMMEFEKIKSELK